MKKRILLLLFILQMCVLMPLAAQMAEPQPQADIRFYIDSIQALEKEYDRLEQRSYLLTGLVAISFLVNAGLMLYVIRLVKNGKQRNQ